MWNIVEMHMVHLMMLELAELSLDEPELEAMLFLDDGNEGEENETGSVRL